jgi:hypothetical protein
MVALHILKINHICDLNKFEVWDIQTTCFSKFDY